MLEKSNSTNLTYLLLGFTEMNISDHKLGKHYFNVLYGLEVCHLTKTNLILMDFPVNRFFIKLFNTCDMQTVIECECQLIFGFKLPVPIDLRHFPQSMTLAITFCSSFLCFLTFDPCSFRPLLMIDVIWYTGCKLCARQSVYAFRFVVLIVWCLILFLFSLLFYHLVINNKVVHKYGFQCSASSPSGLNWSTTSSRPSISGAEGDKGQRFEQLLWSAAFSCWILGLQISFFGDCNFCHMFRRCFCETLK